MQTHTNPHWRAGKFEHIKTIPIAGCSHEIHRNIISNPDNHSWHFGSVNTISSKTMHEYLTSLGSSTFQDDDFCFRNAAKHNILHLETAVPMPFCLLWHWFDYVWLILVLAFEVRGLAVHHRSSAALHWTSLEHLEHRTSQHTTVWCLRRISPCRNIKTNISNFDQP